MQPSTPYQHQAAAGTAAPVQPVALEVAGFPAACRSGGRTPPSGARPRIIPLRERAAQEQEGGFACPGQHTVRLDRCLESRWRPRPSEPASDRTGKVYLEERQGTSGKLWRQRTPKQLRHPFPVYPAGPGLCGATRSGCRRPLLPRAQRSGIPGQAGFIRRLASWTSPGQGLPHDGNDPVLPAARSCSTVTWRIGE